MRAFKDDRSRAYNDVFPAIGKGDINIGVLYPGTIKAFHRHKLQDDYWFVVKGHLRAVTVEEPSVVKVNRVLFSLEKPGSRVIVNSDLFDAYTDKSKYQYHYQNEDRGDGWSQTFVTITDREKPAPIVKVHYLSEGDILHIPKGLWHGLQVLGNEEAIMIYHITEKYNQDTPDEERAPWDSFYDWAISRK